MEGELSRLLREILRFRAFSKGMESRKRCTRMFHSIRDVAPSGIFAESPSKPVTGSSGAAVSLSSTVYNENPLAAL
jgi:hypothetical protein